MSSNPTPTKKMWRSPINLSRLTPKKKAATVEDENTKPSNNVQQAASAATRLAKAKFHKAQAAAAAAAEASAKAKAKAETAAAVAAEAEARADLLASSRPPSSLCELSTAVTKRDVDLFAKGLPPPIDWKARGQLLLDEIHAFNLQPQAEEEHSFKEEEECTAMSSAATSEAQLAPHATSKPSALWLFMALALCVVSSAAKCSAVHPLALPPQASCHWSWAVGCVASNEATLSCRLGLPTTEDRDVCRGLSKAPRDAPRKMRRIPKLSPGLLDRW